MFADRGGFVCEVVMTEHSPLCGCYGLRYPGKSLAKRSTTFQMCIELLCYPAGQSGLPGTYIPLYHNIIVSDLHTDQ